MVALLLVPGDGQRYPTEPTSDERHNMSKAPKRIRINHDDYYASLVGKTKDGRQFFITQPFVPGGNDFVARYLFDKDGAFLDAKIHDLGSRDSDVLPGNALMDDDRVETLQKEMLDELGEMKFGNIKVSPFEHDWNGVTFGLVAQAPEEDDDEWNVIAEPGDYMAFYPPWDGDYDT
jgi:hypothetical protein